MFTAYQSTKLLNRFTLLGIPLKLVRLIEMTLSKSRAMVKIGYYLTGTHCYAI